MDRRRGVSQPDVTADRASPYTHRNVWALAAPMILSNVTVPLLGLVDTAVMGHLDHPRYLAAIAVGSTLFSFLFVGLNFLRMGTTGLAAQARGAGDADGMRAVLADSLFTDRTCVGFSMRLEADSGAGWTLWLDFDVDRYYRPRLTRVFAQRAVDPAATSSPRERRNWCSAVSM